MVGQFGWDQTLDIRLMTFQAVPRFRFRRGRTSFVVDVDEQRRTAATSTTASELRETDALHDAAR